MIELITRKEAGLAYPTKIYPPLQREEIFGISLHWEVPGVRISSKKHRTKNIQSYHMRKWSDIAYSFCVERDGTVCEGRGFRWRAFAEGKVQHNPPHVIPSYMSEGDSGNCVISILMVGMGPKNPDPTPEQLIALDGLIRYIREWHGTKLPVDGHGSHRIKDCPGPFLWQMIYAKAWDQSEETVKPVVEQELFDQEVEPEVSVPDQPEEFQLAAEYARKAQMWAVDLGVSDGSRPYDPVARQELWAMLHRLDSIRHPSSGDDRNPPSPFKFDI